MEGLADPNLRGLGKLLADKPKDAEAWGFARGQALLVAETGNLLLLRPPEARPAKEAWMTHATELRDDGRGTGPGAAAKDYREVPRRPGRCGQCLQPVPPGVPRRSADRSVRERITHRGCSALDSLVRTSSLSRDFPIRTAPRPANYPVTAPGADRSIPSPRRTNPMSSAPTPRRRALLPPRVAGREAGDHPHQPLDAVLLVADLGRGVRDGRDHLLREPPARDRARRFEGDGPGERREGNAVCLPARRLRNPRNHSRMRGRPPKSAGDRADLQDARVAKGRGWGRCSASSYS